MTKTATLLACSLLLYASGTARAQGLPKEQQALGPEVQFDLPSLPGFELMTPLGPAAGEPLAPTASSPYGTGGIAVYDPGPAYRFTPIYSPPPMPGDNLLHPMVDPRADPARPAAPGVSPPWPNATSGLGWLPPSEPATLPLLPALPGEPDVLSGRPSAGSQPPTARQPSVGVPGLDVQEKEGEYPSLVRPFVLRRVLDPRGLQYRALRVDEELEKAAIERLRQRRDRTERTHPRRDDPQYRAGDRDSKP